MRQSTSTIPEFEANLAYELHGNCYLNITWHCTLRCDFCPKFNGTWDVQGYDLRLFREPTRDEMFEAMGDISQYKEMVFCGLGEPTLRLDLLLEIARELKALGKQVRINTDGLANLVYQRNVIPEMVGIIDSLSISMTAHNEAIYNEHTRPKEVGAYQAMLDFARSAKGQIPRVVMTAIDGLEGVDVEACQQIAEQQIGVEFRGREMDVVG